MGSSIVEADSAAVIGSGWWTAVGAGTFLGCLDDSSDATYCEFDYPGGSGDPYLRVSFFNPTIPTNAVITVIGVFARDRAQTLGDIKRNWYWGAVGLPYQQYIATVTNTAFAQHVLPLPVDSVGAPWTPETANGFQMGIAGAGDGVSGIDYYLAELFISVGYNEVPAPVITGPATPLTTTSKPTLTWTVNDPDGDAQNRYRVVVRDNPTQEIVYDSGILIGNVQTFQLPTSLVNGTYDIRLSLGDAINPNMSPFTAPYLLTITAPLPGTPALVATEDAPNNRVKLDITGTTGSVYTSYYVLERSDDGGVTWRVVQNPIGSKGAILLNGTNAYLSVGDFHDFNGTAAFTVEVKFSRVGGGTADALVDKSNATDGWTFTLSTGTALQFARVAASVANSISGGVVSTGIALWAAGTYDATNLREYLNAVLVAGPTASAVSMPNTSVPLLIGAGSVGPAAFANVVIFEVRIWTGARSQANIAADLNVNLTGAEANLLDLWEFNEGEGLTAASSVSGGHTATLVGGAAWTYSAGVNETFYDYTAPLDVTTRYRVKSVHDDGTIFTESLYSAQDTALLSYSADWLKSITDPSLNMTLINQELVSTRTEDIAVFEPLGRVYPVLFGGTIRSEYFGRLRFVLVNDEEAQAFEAIRGTQSTVLLQTCFGDGTREQKFLRLGRVLTNTRRPRVSDTVQVRIMEIEAWEVEPPISQGQ